jgi:hypothetical protein
MMDFFFVQLDECGYYHMIYDSYNWCMTNPMVCMKKQGIMDRIVNNGFQIIGDGITAWNMFTDDSMCYTDEQLIDEITTYVYSFAHIGSTIMGFEGKWDPENKDYEKLTFKEMHHNLRELHHSLPHGKCPVLSWFEQFFPEMPKFEIPASQGAMDMKMNPFNMFAPPSPQPEMDIFSFLMPQKHHKQMQMFPPMPDFSQFKLF